ncbi:histone-lysine N-methyltransferase SMYD3 isoform X2 [Eurytemora carolleeae]|uniref:histone-lysine N-methyltransferase SMYD3 isoform X2 n=1 Tax=Eurytemora carolleeae TaxID=1294199 RepID=UPI000C780EA6|nr:histone-lysine N-methyltransferase SMYD3 isoform X2 [Eurytemora carolleeae]|eukprot:XP_023323148.1 histone-lysine N-methyltransferase SMYD3-like isoform X2 [Eurytemora affinis]
MTGHLPDPDIQCGGCGVQVYCSWACRANDRQHDLECPFIANKGVLPLRDEVRVMIRAILKLQKEQCSNVSLLKGGPGDEVPTQPNRRKFSDLLSHKENFLENEERRQDIILVYNEVEDFLGSLVPSFDEFVEILGRLYINGFEICTDKMETYGWGVYLGPSIMDHSCQPSACVSFSGYRLTVTCLRHVTSLTDLFISYCDTSLPTKLRREKLKRNYFFRRLYSTQ